MSKEDVRMWKPSSVPCCLQLQGFIDGEAGWGSMKRADEGGVEDTVRWRRRLWRNSEMSPAPALRSFGTGADHGGCRRIDQSHVDSLQAVLWTDDLGQTFGPRLAQQLACDTTRTGLTQSSQNRTELPQDFSHQHPQCLEHSWITLLLYLCEKSV